MTNQLPIASIILRDRHRTDHGDLPALAQSILDEGLLQPIGVTPQHELVFGERRLRACRDILEWTEIDVRVVNVSSIVAGEWHENEVRKDFTPSERVAITESVRAEIGNRQGQRLPADRPEVTPGSETREVAAKRAGFSSTTSYRNAKKVVEKGTADLVAKMDSGEVSISRAAEIAKLPAEQQQERLQPLPSKAEPVGKLAREEWRVPENYGAPLAASLKARGIWDRANAGELHAEPVDPRVASTADMEYIDLKRYLANARKGVPGHPSPEVVKAMPQKRREDLRRRAERLQTWAEKLLQLLADAPATGH